MAHRLLFITSFLSLSYSSRTNIHRIRALTSNPFDQLSLNIFDKSRSEKESLSLGKQEFDDGQFFEQCGIADESLADLSSRWLALDDLGKLAKSGQFFASRDKKFLVKAIKEAEESMLYIMNKLKPDAYDRWYGSCDNFRHTLLSPILLTLYGKESFDRRPYIVMVNETALFKSLIEPSWGLEAVYDMKPLPNLAEDLGDLVESLKKGFLSRGSNRLKDWGGWDVVKSMLKRDVDVLAENNLVDFSLFIHVFKPTHDASGPFMLGAEHGCIAEPTQKAAICFRLIDFLTKYTFKRYIESMYKHDKFHEYSSKMMRAFDCLGDLSSSGCTGYVDYKSIVQASGDEKMHLFSTLLASETFKEQYECRSEATRMVYDATKLVNDSEVVVLSGEDEPVPFARHSWYGRGTLEPVELKDTMFSALSNSTGVEALSTAVSADTGCRVLANEYVQTIREQGEHLGMNEGQLQACIRYIYQFATYTRGLHKDNEGLSNVLWNPAIGGGSILVVRKRKFLGSHTDVAKKMRTRECFLRTVVFHCSPKNKGKVVFDYKHSFSDVEILVVEPSRDSGQDYEIWKEAKMKNLLS